MSSMFRDGLQARRRNEEDIRMAKVRTPSNESNDILIFDDLTLVGGHFRLSEKFARKFAESVSTSYHPHFVWAFTDASTIFKMKFITNVYSYISVSFFI